MRRREPPDQKAPDWPVARIGYADEMQRIAGRLPDFRETRMTSEIFTDARLRDRRLSLALAFAAERV